MYKRIRDLREDRDLNQTQIAKILGMSQTGYSKYETGENDLPTAVLIKLARFYGTSIDYILGETDETKRYPQSADKGLPPDAAVPLMLFVRYTIYYMYNSAHKRCCIFHI